MDKSPEAFRTISEVAEHLETPAHVLRFWESRFPQIRPVKRAGGRRYYRPGDVALIAGIRKLLHEDGLTIRGVQKILREQGVRHVAGLVADATTADSAAHDCAAENGPADTDMALNLPAGDPGAGAATARIYMLETPDPQGAEPQAVGSPGTATAQIIRIAEAVVEVTSTQAETIPRPAAEPTDANQPGPLPQGPDNIFAEAFDPPPAPAARAPSGTNQPGAPGPDSATPAAPPGQTALPTRPLSGPPPARRLAARLRALTQAGGPADVLAGDPALVALHRRLSDLRARIARTAAAARS